MATRKASTTPAEINEVRFKPIGKWFRLMDESQARHVSFVVSIGDEPAAEYRPTDQQLFSRLAEMDRIERHSDSNRKDTPRHVVLTGIEYDPICTDELSFDFSDAGESPLRWPVLQGRMSRSELVAWLVEGETADFAKTSRTTAIQQRSTMCPNSNSLTQ